ncbi:MAG TPA: DUF523 and DUF1722 domain-containing protein [Desulfuromonadales bacterium]|jgi:uncharacterized protein YbgA (DUF1722 family)/uncharacterized protein YbbK (DUF523 family)
METKIRMGISSCLLGEKVRYDGGHKLDHFLRDTLGQYVEYVPVCPEVEMGLPTPREALRLVEREDGAHLVFSRSGGDVTEPMLTWARKRVHELEREDLCGFIFKARSPSSGMERVKLYDRNGVPHKTGVGLFARTFMEHFPLLPVEEEGRLHDAPLRENFIECVFTFRRWRNLLAGGRTAARLVDFHTRHKLLLLSHSPEIYRELGRLVAGAGREPAEALFEGYQQLLIKGMRLRTTVPKNCNVLQHLLGYFKKQLTADEKQELLETIDHYRQGHVPLIVPITLVNHYVRKYEQPYLRQQVYLRPHPLELQLRNHV